MKEFKVQLWEDGEYNYRAAFGFRPNIQAYLHDEDEEIRACMIVVPGGGYRVVSPVEGESVAKHFFEMGYNAFVLTYTTNFLNIEPLMTQPMEDLSRAIRIIRRNAQEYHVAKDQIIACGFSAGGHLVGSICVHSDDVTDENPKYEQISNGLNAAILCYPVVTSGEYAHRESFTVLLGKDAKEEQLEYMSIEKQVKKDNPPVFVWHTVTDELVPVENSILLASALKKNNVPFSCHLFEEGKHGLSLANDAWANISIDSGMYTLEQVMAAIEALKSGKVPMSEEITQMFKVFDGSGDQIKEIISQKESNKYIALWPMMADIWIKECRK